MKISIIKDEYWPFYAIEDDSMWLDRGHTIDIPDEEYELLKIMFDDACERMNDVQNKLGEYYKKSCKSPNSSSVELSDHGHGTQCICDACEGIRGEIERSK